MDAEQLTAQAGFSVFGKPAIYDSGAGPLPCRVIQEQGVDQFADDRLSAARIELSVLVAEVGDHVPGATITLNSKDYVVRNLVEDDGVVRRVVVEV